MFYGAGQALLPALFVFDDKYLLTKCTRKSILALETDINSLSDREIKWMTTI